MFKQPSYKRGFILLLILTIGLVALGANRTPVAAHSTGNGATANRTLSVNTQIEAENWSAMSGLQTETTTDTGGGLNLGYADNGDWAQYNSFDFASGASSVNLRVASANSGGLIELHLDSTTGTLIGSYTVASTGGWQTWQTVTVPVSGASGTHNLFLVFKTITGVANLNWFKVNASQTDGSPYNGVAAAIPGTIQAENYNTGGEGVAYHDIEVANQGGQYRAADGVDIEATSDTGGGYDVGWTATGEWLKYTVNVTTAGSYTINFRVASPNTGSTFHLEVDGANVTGTLTVPTTGGWQTWANVTKTGVNLSAGQHVLRWFIDAGGMNFNSLTFTGGTPPTATSIVPTNTSVPPTATSTADGSPFNGTPASLPGTVQAENYNTGGEGIAYHDTEAANQGGQYRTADGVDIEATTDTGGGYNVGWTAAGEWMKYTVNVTSSGTYTFEFRAASNTTGGSFHLEVDGVNVTGILTVPNTGGWQTFQPIVRSGVSLSAGQHVLRWFTDTAGGNYNSFNVYAGNPTPTPSPVPGAWPNRYFAPYLELAMETDMTNIANTTGVKYFTLAFIIDNGTSCNAMWEGANQTMSSTFIDGELANLRAMGGDVIISFGGAAGNELALDCSTVSSLQAQYQSVINKYHITHLDFDVEGGALNNSAANDRRNKAIKNLQTINPNLSISYTLPVDTTGLTSTGLSVLSNAVSNGVRVDVVNLMTMDYANDSRDMGAAATQAATSTKAQLANIFTGKTSAQLWHMIGITSMIGVNDTQPETFTLANASTVLSFSQSNNTQVIAMWAVSRDHQCPSGTPQPANDCSGVAQSNYQFSSIWKAFTQ